VNHLPLRHRKTRGWIAIVALAAALAAAPGAEADPSTSALRDRAATVMAQIDRLDALRADATLREQSARTRLLAARVDLAGTKVQIADAELGLRSARDALAQLVVSSYKNGNPDAIKWNSGFKVAAHIDQEKKVWYATMKIPFSALTSTAPAAGQRLRIGLFRCAGTEPNRLILSWQPTMSKTFHSPEHFGSLLLTAGKK